MSSGKDKGITTNSAVRTYDIVSIAILTVFFVVELFAGTWVYVSLFGLWIYCKINDIEIRDLRLRVQQLEQNTVSNPLVMVHEQGKRCCRQNLR